MNKTHEELLDTKQLADLRLAKIMELQQRLAEIWHVADPEREKSDDFHRHVLEKIMTIADPGNV